MRKLQVYFGLFLLIILPFFTKAQVTDSTKKKIKHSFTSFQLEARAELEYLGTYQWTNPEKSSQYHMDKSGWNSNYGFHGQYFNFLLGGDIGDHISYFLRQRIIAKPGSVSFFDNTDFLYIQYRFNDQWAIRLGKEALYVGGYEYDAAPIDVYYYTHFWGEIHCFQLGVSASYTDKQKKNKIIFQFANSPHIYYEGSGDEWKKGLFSYNLLWNGNFGVFSTLYSINLMEYERGSFVNYISLGNKLSFNKWSIYVDYMNRASSFRYFFRDFTVVGRLDWHVSPSVNLFAKAGYDQNFAEDIWVEIPKDPMMTPGFNYHFYGIGLEFRPLKYQDLRIHAFVANSVKYSPGFSRTDPETSNTVNTPVEGHGSLQINVGASWTINFMKYLPDRLK